MVASVEQSDCRCGLVPTLQLVSAETPARAAASASLGLNFIIVQ